MFLIRGFILDCYFFFFKQKTAYEMRISDWSSGVCSSDLNSEAELGQFDLTAQLDLAQKFRQLGVLDRHFLAAERLGQGLQLAGRDAESGRASCRERGCQYVSLSVVAVSLKKKYRMSI